MSASQQDSGNNDELPAVTVCESNGLNLSEKPTRLVISHMVNDFFKSYAGKQCLGPFHQSFTSVVGPNGSGKSNVIDAMLFVFGYRSKKIRSKKLSLLIHNSEKYQNVQSCTVSVFFEKIIDLPGGGFQVVPNSQFVVSRTARKDGSSDYYVDNKKRTFKEVGTLLRTSGIDLDHNRFLILQGEVEQIATMKSKAETENDEGMLEYLEDIIGSSRLKQPIEQLASDVEELNDLRREKLNRVKVTEKEKDELEGAKSEAIEYLTLENEIIKQKRVLYQKYSCTCLENATKAETGKSEIQKQIDEIEALLKELSKEKKLKGNERKKIKHAFDKLTEAAEKSKKIFSDFENTDCALQKELQHKQSDAKKLRTSLQKEKDKLEALLKAPEKSSAEIERLSKNLVDLEGEKRKEEEKLKEVMAGLQDATKDLQAEKEEKEKELLEKQKRVNETKSKLDIANSELELYQSQHNGLQTQMTEAQDKLKNVTEGIEERESKVAALRKDIPKLEKDLKSKQSELAQLTKEEEQIQSRLKSNRTKLEEARSSLQSMKSRDSVLSALIAAKNSGELPGIYGRLGDLGAINQKYDVAISTACGPLDFVVVDTIDTASKCVDFLKEHRVGSTTFIALDKMEKWAEHSKRKIKTPENVPRLFDLIQVDDPKIANAFFYAIQNTLVADTLDQATRIAYGKGARYRVVTLQGELIEASGTMSGGGKNIAKGRMGRKVIQEVDPQGIEKFVADITVDVNKLETLKAKKSTLEEQIEALRNDFTSKTHALEKAAMEKEALKSQKQELTNRIETLKNQLKASVLDANHTKNLVDNVAACKQDHKRATKATADIEEAVQKMHKKIMETGGSKLKTQQAKVNTVNSLIDEVTQCVTKANVAAKTANRNIAKAEAKTSSFIKEIEENDAAIEKLQVDVKNLEEDAVKILDDYNSSQERMEIAEQELKQAQEEYGKFEQQESSLKEKEVDLKHDAQKFDNLIKENRSKLKHWSSEMNKLVLHNLNNDTQDMEDESFPTLSNEELEAINKEEISYDITVKEERLAQMKPNMAAIAEYRKKEEAYLDRVLQLDNVTQERDSKRKEHEAKKKQRLEDFMAGFGVIATKLKEMYQMITLGGDAGLELVDSLDPFSEGIVFCVRPPKKSWKNISNLSGGEKTLSSLALVFALHHYKPTPLYVMDEIDAALDFKNVSIIANYIKERTKNAQFIIISLRHNMFELADRLVGIYKTDNCTKSVAINPSLIDQAL